jgi:hypothetical protein
VAQVESLDHDDLRLGTPGGPAIRIIARPDRAS